jgi:DtxR family Mn-dependent transcriptional regulator
MAEMTGFPRAVPMASRFPTRTAACQRSMTCASSIWAWGIRGAVSRVRTHEPEKLQYYRQPGAGAGHPIRDLGRAPFNGPMRLRVGREEVVIGYELMKSLWVT